MAKTVEPIDYSNRTIEEPINIDFWTRESLNHSFCIKVDTSKMNQKVDLFYGIDFSNSSLDSTANFDNLKIWNPSYFKSATFRSMTSFDSTDFYDRAVFKSAKFNSNAEFLNTVFNKTASFQDVIFRFNIVFENTKFDSNANFVNAFFDDNTTFNFSTFNSSANFGEAAFNDSTTFLGTVFNSNTNFYGATFESKISFSNVSFYSEAFFNKANFHSTAYFIGVVFDSIVYFYDVRFDSTAIFICSNFNSIAEFKDATFFSNVDFINATFNSVANFKQATFNCNVNFRDAVFKSISDFSYADFNSSGCLDFRQAQFYNHSYFYDTVLPAKIDFRHVKDILHEIDLTFAKLDTGNKKCKIALAGADISKLKLNMDLFELWFPEDEVLTFDQQTSVYKSVLKKLKDDGFDESYQILDIEYKKKKNRHDGWFSWQILDTADDLFWNYRYSPLQAILCTLVLWLIFSVIMLPYYPKMQNWVYKIGFLEKEGTKRIGLLIRSFAYTGVVFFGLKIDISKFKTRVVRNHPWLFSYLMFVYVVGVICLVLIVNVVFK